MPMLDAPPAMSSSSQHSPLDPEAILGRLNPAQREAA
jgi:hypothetical protein